MRKGLVVSLLWCLAAVGGVAADESSELDHVLATMERQASVLGQHEIHFQIESRARIGVDSYQASKVKYRELFDGSRRRLESAGHWDVNSPRDQEDAVHVFFNGQHNLRDDATRRGVIGEVAGFPPDYVLAAYLFQEGVYEALRQNRKRIGCRPEAIDGRQLLKCSWRDSKTEADVGVWVDPGNYFQPAQCQLTSYSDPVAHPDRPIRAEHRMVVSEFWRTDSAALPSKVRIIYENIWRDGRRETLTESVLTVSDVKTDRQFSSADFSIDFPDGYVMTDVAKRVYYIQGESGSERPLGEGVDSTPVGPGGARLPDARGWRWWFAIVGFVIGGVLYWFRWRSE